MIEAVAHALLVQFVHVVDVEFRAEMRGDVPRRAQHQITEGSNAERKHRLRFPSNPAEVLPDVFLAAFVEEDVDIWETTTVATWNRVAPAFNFLDPTKLSNEST